MAGPDPEWPAWQNWTRKLAKAGNTFAWLAKLGIFDDEDWARSCLRNSPPALHEPKIRQYFRTKGGAKTARVPIEPVHPVFICFTQRSGSNRLAELLASTGKLPLAKGNFSWQDVIKRSEKNNFASFEQYCADLIGLRKANGFFLCKTSAPQISFLTKEKIIPELLSKPRFIHLRRRDLLAQAISFVIAHQTGQWSTRRSETEREPIYDPVAIAAQARLIAAANAWFEEYFAIFGFPMFEVIYEDLAADEAGTVSAITEWLGLGPTQINPEKTRLQPQRTSLNDDWRSRFLNESRQYFGAAGDAIGIAAAPVTRR